MTPCAECPLPRQARLDALGVLYPVMVRGSARRALFRDDADHAECVARLAGLTVYAWALLPKHAHLLVRTGRQRPTRGSPADAGPGQPLRAGLCGRGAHPGPARRGGTPPQLPHGPESPTLGGGPQPRRPPLGAAPRRPTGGDPESGPARGGPGGPVAPASRRSPGVVRRNVRFTCAPRVDEPIAGENTSCRMRALSRRPGASSIRDFPLTPPEALRHPRAGAGRGRGRAGSVRRSLSGGGDRPTCPQT